jgi:hypothetical protein
VPPKALREDVGSAPTSATIGAEAERPGDNYRNLESAVEIEFLQKHEPHLRYDWFRYRGRPLGSGAIESAMPRVINLRLKGNGIYWCEENAEAMLVLRAAALTGRWREAMETVHEAMASDRRREWRWRAPDLVAELNSGVVIKPPESQPESTEQPEALAA